MSLGMLIVGLILAVPAVAGGRANGIHLCPGGDALYVTAAVQDGSVCRFMVEEVLMGEGATQIEVPVKELHRSLMGTMALTDVCSHQGYILGLKDGAYFQGCLIPLSDRAGGKWSDPVLLRLRGRVQVAREGLGVVPDMIRHGDLDVREGVLSMWARSSPDEESVLRVGQALVDALVMGRVRPEDAAFAHALTDAISIGSAVAERRPVAWLRKAKSLALDLLEAAAKAGHSALRTQMALCSLFVLQIENGEDVCHGGAMVVNPEALNRLRIEYAGEQQ